MNSIQRKVLLDSFTDHLGNLLDATYNEGFEDGVQHVINTFDRMLKAQERREATARLEQAINAHSVVPFVYREVN